MFKKYIDYRYNQIIFKKYMIFKHIYKIINIFDLKIFIIFF